MRPTLTVRFWIYHREGFVRISLRDGQSIEVCSGGANDEGWARHVETWERDGETVVWRECDDGVDCDGRTSYDATYECPVTRLAVSQYGIRQRSETDRRRAVLAGFDWPESDNEPIALMRPDWQPVRSGRRDYSAEASGY